jgi:hypothetical protein
LGERKPDHKQIPALLIRRFTSVKAPAAAATLSGFVTSRLAEVAPASVILFGSRAAA